MTAEGRLRRVFSSANLAAAVSAIVVFYLTLLVRDTNLGVLFGAILAGIVGGGVWYLLTISKTEPTLGESLRGFAEFGAIPVGDSGPAPTISDRRTSDRYASVLRQIEAHTNGRVLLVSSPGPGQGASSVALNLSIAATQAGRRVMLVDADPSQNGLGRFLSSGPTPGLSEIAKGEADLASASRMWRLDDGTAFPMLPAGSELADTSALSGILVADAFDVVSEHADLILIDVPPVMWSSATPDLGAHADGTVLVMTDSASPATVDDAIAQLEAAGAPVVGYVRNRSEGGAVPAPHRIRRAVTRAGVFALTLLLGYSVYTGVQLLASWSRVETEALDTKTAQAALGDQASPPETAAPEDVVELDDEPDPADQEPLPVAPTEAYETLLLIGNDEIGGTADVILYLVRPTNGADPFMVSLPRDLYVKNPCTGGNTRINTLIKGCKSKDINGPTLLAHKVEEITGITVDHFAWFHFDGFIEIVDAVGGVELCFDNPVRDAKAQLDMPAGCTQADGAQTLSWVRSRKTQEYRNGGWYSVPGSGDLKRNQHQQDVIIQLFAKMKNFDSPTDLTRKVASLADTFILDKGLTIPGAVNLAWGLRGIDIEDINRLELSVRLTRSKTGQSVIVMTQPFDELLAEVYGNRLPTEDGSSEQAGTEDAAEETASAFG